MKNKTLLSLGIAASLMVTACFGCGQTTTPPAEPAAVSTQTEATESAASKEADAADSAAEAADTAAQETPEEPLYTPEDRSGSIAVEDGQAALVFEPNYEGAKEIEPMIVEAGSIVSKDDIPTVTREGYHFAGWYDTPHPELSDGVAEGEWLFGEKYLYTYFEVPEDEVTSMPIDQSMTLYARWVKETPVSSVEDLQAMAEDLYGYYVLEADLDLSGEDWTPLGRWQADYESANDNWWTEAFRGTLDGNGHTILGLTLSIQDGDAFGYTGLFGALNGAVVKDLTLADYTITIDTTKGVNAAPLCGFAQGWGTTIENVTTSGTIDASIATEDEGVTFTSLTGLVGAGWAGNYINCDVSGDLTFDVNVKNGSEINIGGINGEGYALSDGCKSHMNMKGSVASRGEAADGSSAHTDLYIGGIQGGATAVKNCVADGSIFVSMSRADGNANLYVGGIVGQERYNSIEDCLSQVEITVNGAENVYCGGITGAWNSSTYGSIGYFGGITIYEISRCLAANTVTVSDVRGTLTSGAAVSSVPAQLEIRFSDDMDPLMTVPGVQRISSIAALESGLAANDAEACDGSAYNEDGSIPEDGPKAVHLYASEDEMTGNALEDILGDGWTYTDGQLPVPQK